MKDFKKAIQLNSSCLVNQLQKEMRCWWGKCCVYSKFETIKSTKLDL